MNVAWVSKDAGSQTFRNRNDKVNGNRVGNGTCESELGLARHNAKSVTLCCQLNQSTYTTSSLAVVVK